MNDRNDQVLTIADPTTAPTGCFRPWLYDDGDGDTLTQEEAWRLRCYWKDKGHECNFIPLYPLPDPSSPASVRAFLAALPTELRDALRRELEADHE